MEPSAAFRTSCQKFEQYPENLCHSYIYPLALQAYRHRLSDATNVLFKQDGEAETKVPFRDLDPSGNLQHRTNILSDEALREFLGYTMALDSTGRIISGDCATKTDPRCRFIFLSGEHSRTKLNITRTMLARICSYHQIMPRFLDFLFLFGVNESALDLRYSGFREQTSLTANVETDLKMPKLGRSGRRYQTCYNLKGFDYIPKPGVISTWSDWSTRQTALYHSFDVETGNALWLIIKGNLEFKDRIQEITGPAIPAENRKLGKTSEAFRASLVIHSLATHWATEGWRWYMRWLESLIEDKTREALSGRRHLADKRKKYTPADLQENQHLEEKVNEAIMIISANCTVLLALKEYYENLCKELVLDEDIRGDVAGFSVQLKDAIADLKMQSSRGELLAQIISQRKTLVLQHLQAQASEKMEQLSVMSQKEAVAMRIITVVTLIFLPATAVSTFFSTDVVKYQNQSGGNADSGGQFSWPAMWTWLAVTLPLMAVTFVIAWFGYRMVTRNLALSSIFKFASRRESPGLPTQEPKVTSPPVP